MAARQADAMVVGSGLTAWVAALELSRRGRRVVVASTGGATSEASPLVGHSPLGPLPYPALAHRLGRDVARDVWETGRESTLALIALSRELGLEGACSTAGGFVLGRDRAEAAALAEAEDELREGGFGGEFLDRYMLESRFDVTGFTGGYWVADEVEYDGPGLTAEVRRAAQDAGVALAALRMMEADARGVRAQTDDGEWRTEWMLLACEPAEGSAAIVAPLLPGAVRREAALTALDGAASTGRALPSPARTFDGAQGWQGVAADSAAPPLAWAEGDRIHPTLDQWLAGTGISSSHTMARLTALSPADGLPAIGALSPAVFVAWGGQGPWTFAPVLAARLAVREALGAAASVPAVFRASRTMG